MKICILETTPPQIEKNETIGRTDAHYRNSKLIASELNADLFIFKSQYLNALKYKYDVIILACNSIGLPYELIKKLILNNHNAKLFYISNEYTNITGGFLNKYNWHIIANFETTKNKIKCAKSVSVLNINLLFSRKSNSIYLKKYDCIYYGTFRKDRSIYFKKYLQGDIYLSTSGRGFGGQANFKFFKHLGCNFKSISKLKWVEKKETLNLFKYSLYIEDVYTHKVFNNLANRWYEAGFCNVVVFFDINCLNTIKKSEIAQYENEIMDYIVTDYNSLQNKIKYCNLDFEKHLNIQKRWRLNELQLRKDMIDNLKNIIKDAIH